MDIVFSILLAIYTPCFFVLYFTYGPFVLLGHTSFPCPLFCLLAAPLLSSLLHLHFLTQRLDICTLFLLYCYLRTPIFSHHINYTYLIFYSPSSTILVFIILLYKVGASFSISPFILFLLLTT